MTAQDRAALHTALWGIQGALAASAAAVGFVKLTVPLGALQGLGLLGGAAEAVVGASGVVDLAAAAAILLPSATRILPGVAPAAAACLAGAALLGIAVPETAGAFGAPALNGLAALLAGLVAWGRASWARVAPLELREDAEADGQAAAAFFERLRRDDQRDSTFRGRTVA